jgi:hypothetical protein
MENRCYGHPSLALTLLNANVVPTSFFMYRHS